MTPFSEKTDEEIAALVQSGDVESFGTLVERYEGKLMRYAGRFLFDDDDAKDMVQNAFIKAYVNIQGFDATRRFSPWIYRIAHNEFVNALKRKKGRETVSLFDFDVLFPHLVEKENVEGKAMRRELKEMLDRSLQKLHPKYREPLVLFYFEEMGYSEIADILHIPISTVGVRIRRGKEALRKTVGEFN